MKPHLLTALFVLLAPASICRGQEGRTALHAERRQNNAENIPERNPYASEADIEAGQKLFVRRCAHCHSVHGEGGRGVNLTTGQYRLGGSDRQLFSTLRNGIPDSEMPGSRAAAIEIWRLVAYVKRLGAAGVPEKAQGDPGAGRAVYEKSGCPQCHSIGSAGGDTGPELTAIGRRRSLKYLRDSIVDPGADVPPSYRSDTVTTLDGRKIRGIHLNEDDYSIQLRDTSGNLRCFLKTELREFMHDKDSLMPAYRSLSATDLDNLVAYLNSMR
jgi:putative heme-binding domain-containing protein